ncbi:hypothetical protein [Legionella erythra]|uniref:Uncharacterized protein n=1 Tax=Legionella erythra TaxID=448 RepID=A0A0W0TNL5_LEGER|nr:hypothetical protein [Legionella erythra]KTC97163.1 hypothetical protein Lery_1728 [Legionella erythra]
MFEWLTRYFYTHKQRYTTPVRLTEQPIAVPLDKKITTEQDNIPSSGAASTPDSSAMPQSNKNQSSYVYIWLKTLNGPGHAAIQIGGSKPKLNPDDEGDYGSIHPSNFPSMGPMAVLPLEADMAQNLMQDMQLEANAGQNPLFTDMDTPSPLPTSERPPKKPDLTFALDHLDTNAMQQRLLQVKKQIDEGDMHYQLLPKVDVVKLLQDATHFIAYDPLDIHSYMNKQRQSPLRLTQVTNCSTLVADVLNAGGASIETSKPWGITPDGLADELRHAGIKLN